MRLKACKEAGLKEVPVIIAENLTEVQEKEFIIKDNV
jgi:ParB-like chromosome segregation protein Spo0J